MRNRLWGAAAVLLLVFLPACDDDDDHHHDTSTVYIAGDVATDGYVEQDLGGGLTAYQADGIRVQAPVPAVAPERRGFASFSIASIPVGATLDRAEMRLYVDWVASGGPATVDVYHVHYGDPLLAGDFNTSHAYMTTLSIDPSRAGSTLILDVLPELQLDVDDPSVGFFQVMLVATGGAVEFQDAEQSFTVPTTGPAPELDVTYW